MDDVNVSKHITKIYMVLDLKDYSVSYLDDVPEGGWTYEHKTEKLVLRYIPAGSFVMGSPENELGRRNDEKQHKVTLTRPFYIGVFQLTERQYELITGKKVRIKKKNHDLFFLDINPEDFYDHPMGRISYHMIRGFSAGSNWPEGEEVDKDSFLGTLREKTGLNFDLPTEAQWEYACRAGTTTAWNNGTDITDDMYCDNLDKLARYNNFWKMDKLLGRSSQWEDPEPPVPVGSFPPNAWGLYDMQRNIGEWCRDWYGAYCNASVSDPKGATSGTGRVIRGGGWYDRAQQCRSAARFKKDPNYDRFSEPMHVDPFYIMCISYGLRLVLVQ